MQILILFSLCSALLFSRPSTSTNLRDVRLRVSNFQAARVAAAAGDAPVARHTQRAAAANHIFGAAERRSTRFACEMRNVKNAAFSLSAFVRENELQKKREYFGFSSRNASHARATASPRRKLRSAV